MPHINTTGVPVAVVGDNCPNGNPGGKGHHGRRADVNRRWRIIDGGGIGWDVNHLGVDRLDLDDGVGNGDDLLRRVLQTAEFLRFDPQGLDGVHEFLRLLEEGLA